MPAIPQHTIFQISDTGITIDFGNIINDDVNRIVLIFFHKLQDRPFPGIIEAVPSYSSLTIYYDLLLLKKLVPAEKSVSEWLAEQIRSIIPVEGDIEQDNQAVIEIPVCYDSEYAPDIKLVAEAHQVSVNEVVEAHMRRTYRVHMLGFLPGFAYMGELDKRLFMPRKKQPAQVVAGSVGIVGRQTGIYPMNSPGGWSIIGRTPLKLFNVNKEKLTLLNAGDRVRFTAITKHEFKNY